MIYMICVIWCSSPTYLCVFFPCTASDVVNFYVLFFPLRIIFLIIFIAVSNQAKEN